VSLAAAGAASAVAAPTSLLRARLPLWLLPPDWPREGAAQALADLHIDRGRIASRVPSASAAPWAPSASSVPAAPSIPSNSSSPSLSSPSSPPANAWDLAGAAVLPCFVDAHTHLDAAFTRERVGYRGPGLLAGIEGKRSDRHRWTADDLRGRAERALSWACEAGTTVLRTHVDWPDSAEAPTAWAVYAELAAQWRGRLELQRVSLCRPSIHSDRDAARRLARKVAAAEGGKLGSFIHTSNWDPAAIRHLLQAAADHGLDLDLHVDEELDPLAQGLEFVAQSLREMRFPGRVVCGHNCALSVQDERTALRTLDAVARAPITLVSLPQNNLLLQDAADGRTPRLRGLTLLKEARARGIPLLIASDSVQDPFCALGSFDPVEAFMAGVLGAQLDEAFDRWSDTLCRSDWLEAGPGALPLGVGSDCDLVIFTATTAGAWPSRAHRRVVLRQGRRVVESDLLQLPG
jgi:cytosine/creatinine deaminase